MQTVFRKLHNLALLIFRYVWLVRLMFPKDKDCNLCKGDTRVREAYGRKFLECQSCGLIFTGDYPAFFANFGMGTSGSWGGMDVGGEREDFLVRMLADALKANTFLLYGVGGTLAFRVLLDEGFDVYGCDLSADVIKIRQEEFGHERFFHVNDLKSKRRLFDVVIACEVFEHFHDPIKWLRIISNSMKDDGVLCGTTNFYSGGPIEDGQKVGYMSLRNHVVYWSEQSMAYLLDRFGMSLVTFEMVCPGSVKPDLKFNDLFPNKRVFFASAEPKSIALLKEAKERDHILPLDTSDYPHPAYRQ